MKKLDLNSESAYESLEAEIPNGSRTINWLCEKFKNLYHSALRGERKLFRPSLHFMLATGLVMAGGTFSKGCVFDKSGIYVPYHDGGVDGGDATPNPDADPDGDAQPNTENCENGVDDNDNNLIDCDDPECDNYQGDGWECNLGNKKETACDDGQDNDGDSSSDCADPDCDGVTGNGWECEGGEKTETDCGNGLDDDNDGDEDCLDPDCASHTGPQGYVCEYQTETICDDGGDNDLDGWVDCRDADCAGVGYCENPEQTCDDTLDNDGDGLADCADPNCMGQTGPGGIDCELGTELTCDDNGDNDGDGGADCADQDCDGQTGSSGQVCEYSVELTCDDGLDNDGDGNADCTDIDCDGYTNSTAGWGCSYPEMIETNCTDDLNNDGDANGADCGDPDCEDRATDAHTICHNGVEYTNWCNPPGSNCMPFPNNCSGNGTCFTADGENACICP